VRERHHLLTPNAYGAFILWMVSYNAAKVNDCRAFWLLLPEARWYGRVRPFDLLTHVAYFYLPRDLRRRMAAWAARWRQSSFLTLTQLRQS
jgi:hypothetical protein